MTRLRMGLVGPGFIARHHIDAVRRLGDVDVIAIAGSNQTAALRRAREWHVERAYGSYAKLLRDGDVDVVHNTTPNHLHFEVSMAVLQAGKHVISDKPLAIRPAQSRALRDAAAAAGVAHVVTFNYRGNPMVQEMRERIARGDIGAQSFVHGRYLQDWMTDPHVYSWRSDPALGGPSSALADIGSHWCDLAEHVTGSRITAVLADLTTVIGTRYPAAAASESFPTATAASGAGDRTPVTVSGEDLASVLVRFDSGAKGCFSVGQVLPGHKNDLQLEVSGRHASLHWCQEAQNQLWVGRHAEPNQLVTKDPAQLGAAARRYALLPAGHQEAWADAFRNVIADAYGWIRDGGRADLKPCATATFDDGLRSSCLIEAMLESHRGGGVWIRPQA